MERFCSYVGAKEMDLSTDAKVEAPSPRTWARATSSENPTTWEKLLAGWLHKNPEYNKMGTRCLGHGVVSARAALDGLFRGRCGRCSRPSCYSGSVSR